jgi:starch-binding outer membrane protein, SusD/RagB family
VNLIYMVTLQQGLSLLALTLDSKKLNTLFMNKISIFIFVVVLLFSCKKSELDLRPFNQIETSDAFKTQADINLAINGVYAGLRTSGSYFVSGSWSILADLLSDNLILSQGGRLSQTNFYEWRYTANNTSGIFGNAYVIARRANAVIENIDNFSDVAFKNNIKGEALALRALVYFDMSRVYGKTYANASATDSIAPYITTTDITILPSKEPVRGFYTKIVSDLTTALPLINVSNGTGRLNKASVSGLLSRVYLYMGDWANCITASTNALGATPNLPNIATFPSVWTDATESGVLFKVLNTTLDAINTPGVNYYQVVGGGVRSEYVVDYDFRQLFLPSDVRTNTYIQTSPFNGVSQNHVVKYNGRVGAGVTTGVVRGVVDYKVLRTAEVLLNRAEAYYRSGNETSALSDLNLLKANRYSPHTDVILSGASLLNEILKERRLELAFEGDRFWDLKRLNLPVNRSATNGDRADGTGVPPIFKVLGIGDYRFLLPYPAGEINFNNNFKQNPGY